MISDQDPFQAIQELRFVDCERTRFYSKAIDHHLAKSLESFDFDSLPYGETQEDVTARVSTNLTGLLAFAWANPLSRFHQDESFLKHVRARLAEFARTQQGGGIVYKKVQPYEQWPDNDPLRNNLEIAWDVEPLVMAALWVDDELSDVEREAIRAMARKAADTICGLPCNERNNRGSVRCAVLCLLGRYLSDANYISIARHDFHREPVRVFNRDGQINEGPGPDGNYSGTSFIYLYTYRVLSGDRTIDEQLAAGARWYTIVSDPSGSPSVFGASTRVAIGGPTKVADYIPAMERYAEDQPHFSWLIENHYKPTIPKGGPIHACHPYIWAMLEHNGKEPLEDPNWFCEPTERHEFYTVDEGADGLYFIFKQDYHAATFLSGRAPYKGFQNWGYKLEPPVVWPTLTHASKTLGWGIDTSTQRVSGTKFYDRRWIQGPPHILVDRVEHVWHHFVQTRTTLLYLISCEREREDIFVIDREHCGNPIIEEDVLHYEGREGRMHFAQARPERKELENGCHVVFSNEARTHLYAFSNESFECLELDPDGDSLQFKDDTGEYRLNYELRFYADDDLVPIGSKGFGMNDATKYVRTEVGILG